MHYLGSNSCHVKVGYKFLMKHILACVLRQLRMIANNNLKQLIIPECHIGVYHNEDINVNGRNSMFDGRQNYVKKVVTKIRMFFLAYVIFTVLILTSYHSRTLVRISLYQQIHPKSHYAFDIPDIL